MILDEYTCIGCGEHFDACLCQRQHRDDRPSPERLEEDRRARLTRREFEQEPGAH